MSPEEKSLSDKIIALYDQPAKDIMEEAVVVEKKTKLDQVIHTLADKEIDHVWVVDTMDNMKVVGVITEKDVINCMRRPNVEEDISWDVLGLRSLVHTNLRKAESIMTRHLIKEKQEDRVFEIIENMYNIRIRHIPIVEGDVLKGEITSQTLSQVVSNFLKNEE